MKCTKQYRLTYTGKAEELVKSMTLEEKVSLMSGTTTFTQMVEDAKNEETGHYNHQPYPAGGIPGKNIPPMLFCDGPRGVVCGTGKSTCFPVSMLRGATFDLELEEEIGRAIGQEVLASGGNLFAGVCVNLPYHPGWGRSQESYGEDSFALGQMGAALVRGVQQEDVIACVKHYAFNSMEISRFKVSVECDRRSEREVYLPHFKDCIDAGAAGVMSAYNLYKGVYCGHSDYLLRKVLKEEWDFDGFVMSDFAWGISDTVAAANGGMDMEMCCTQHFGEKLVQAVQNGLVQEEVVDEAAVRILRTLLSFTSLQKPVAPEVWGNKNHAKLALKAAAEGITLLENKNNLLPMDKTTGTVAVLGRLSNQPNLGDHGSSRVYPAYTVTLLKGIEEKLSPEKVLHYDGPDKEKAAEIARQADRVVLAVGFDFTDEGEYVSSEQDSNYTGETGGDREGLGLHKEDIALIEAVTEGNPQTTVVLFGGNAITMAGWKDKAGAIIMAYYPGQEGGTALGDILFGDCCPEGHLPFAIPAKEEDLLPVNWRTTSQYYSYLHGYTLLDNKGIKPQYPYGYGLSYTTFLLKEEHFGYTGGQVWAECCVANTGSRAGGIVVQMYIGFPDAKVFRPVKALKGFTRIALKPGEEKNVRICCPIEKLSWYNPATASWELEKTGLKIYIGTSSGEEDLATGYIAYSGW